MTAAWVQEGMVCGVRKAEADKNQKVSLRDAERKTADLTHSAKILDERGSMY